MTTNIFTDLLGPICELFYKYKKSRDIYLAYINTLRNYGFSTSYSLNFGFELYSPFDINHIKLQPGVYTTNSNFVSYPNLSSASPSTTINVSNHILIEDLPSSGLSTILYENKTLPLKVSIYFSNGAIVGIASNYYTDGIPYNYNKDLDENVIRSFESDIITDSELSMLIFVNLESTTFVGINSNWVASPTSLYSINPISYRYNNGYSQFYSYKANMAFIRTDPDVDLAVYNNLFNSTYMLIYNWINRLDWSPDFMTWLNINYIYVSDFVLLFLTDYFGVSLGSVFKTYGYNSGSATYGFRPDNWTMTEMRISIDEIVAQGQTVVRMDFNTKDSMNLHMIGEYEPIQKEFHRLLFKYMAQNNLQPCIVLNSDIQTQYAYRLALDNYLGITSYVNNQTAFVNATYRRKKRIPEVFWDTLNYHMTEILELGAEVFALEGATWTDYAMVDIDNETAYVIDAEFAADPSIPYGTYPPGYADMMAHRLDPLTGIDFNGAIFVPGAYENQAGITTELATGGGAWRGSALWENVHLYVAWVSGDTKYTIADKLLVELETFLDRLDALDDPYRSGKSVVITEYGATNVPLASREEILSYSGEILSQHSRVISAQAYAMIEMVWNGAGYSGSNWAVLDYEHSRWGPAGFVTYSYSTYPSSWIWSNYAWSSPTDWSVTGIFKQRECTQTVDTNLTVQFKIWLNVTDFYWAESYVTGYNLGYGVYTFVTDTSVNNLGENIIFSMFLYGTTSAGNGSNPVGGAGEIQIAKIGYDGNGTAKIEVYTGDGVNPVLAGSQSYSGTLPSGPITFSMEYRSSFITWNWYDQNGSNIFNYTHTGFIPDPAVMNNYVRIAIYNKRGQPVITTKPVYVALSSFTFSS